MRKKFKSMEEKDYEEKNDERSDGSSSDSGTFRRLWREGNVRQPRGLWDDGRGHNGPGLIGDK